MTWNPNSFRSRAKLDIYFLEAPSASLIKLGITGDLSTRLLTIDVCSPVPLRLLLSVKGTRLQERGLHRFFASARVRGEWFAADVLRPFVDRLREMDAASVASLLQKIHRNTRRSFGDADRFPGRRAGGMRAARLAEIVAEASPS